MLVYITTTKWRVVLVVWIVGVKWQKENEDEWSAILVHTVSDARTEIYVLGMTNLACWVVIESTC